MKKSHRNTKRLKPISLYPLTVEEALEAFLHTPPLTKKRRVKTGKWSKKG